MIPTRPLLIYLGIRDLDEHIRRTIAQRPVEWGQWLGDFFGVHPWGRRVGRTGIDALLSFYREWAPIEAELVSRHVGPKLILENAFEGWSAAYATIEEFLCTPA
jgi:hypothetical protein